MLDRTGRARRRLRLPTVLTIACIGLVACGPSDPLETIRQQQARGEFEETLAPLRELLDREDGASGEVHFLYGRALVAQGDFGASTWPLRRAMQDPEWRRPAALEMVRPALINHDFHEVVELMDRLLEDDPDDAVALLYRAQANAYWRVELESAVDDALRVLELEPDRLEAYEPLIIALQALGRGEEARERLAEAGRRLEETESHEGMLAWHCATTAIFAAEAGEIEEARAKWEECLEGYPADYSVVSGAIAFFEAQGESARSLEVVRQAHAEADRPERFRFALALRLAHAGSRDEGETLLREATETEDPYVGYAAWADLARFFHLMREHGKAAEAHERAIGRLREVEEPTPQMLFQWADALVVSGQLDRALEVSEEIDVPSQRSLILGRVAQERGNPERALAHFDEALVLWPDNPWARYYAALAAEQVGDFDRALEEYRYSIRIDPQATDARSRAAKLLVAEGRLRRAYHALFVDVSRAPLDPQSRIYSMYLMARAANPRQLQGELAKLALEGSPIYPEALRQGALGAAEVVGPRGALGLLRDAPGVNYANPRFAPALHELVRFAHAGKQPEIAARALEAALAAHPEEPSFLALRGLHLELGGDRDAEARAAYERALEEDSANAWALMGLGRLERGEDPAAAAALFERAYRADPSEPDPQLAIAQLEVELGQRRSAARRLEAILRRHPLEPRAAAQRAALDLKLGQVSEETVGWAERAVRFGAGASALELLGQAYAALGEAAEAEKALERAQALREREERARVPDGEQRPSP